MLDWFYDLPGRCNRHRCRKAARLILKATQGERHSLTIQKCGKEISDEVFNLARWVEA